MGIVIPAKAGIRNSSSVLQKLDSRLRWNDMRTLDCRVHNMVNFMTEYIQIVTTVESENDAKKIAELLVDRRLAACVQIAGPVMSRFWWDGKIDTAEEYQVIIKSRNDLFPEVESVITDAHPYDVPEILAIPILAAGKGYLNWLSEELKSSKE